MTEIIREEHYLTDDPVLAHLEIPNPCEIRLDISDEYVRLLIGPRDFEWKRGNPDLQSAGTTVTR